MSARHRTARSHRPVPRATTTAAPDLHGGRELAALVGLSHPAPLHPDELAVLPAQCVIPPEEVARIHAGVTNVLAGLGQGHLLTSETVTGLRQAAARGCGLAVPPHVAKALWRFCDTFGDREPLLRGAREGLRVTVPA